MVKNPPNSAGNCTWSGTKVSSLGQEEPLEEEMATHSGILAGRIPWRKERSGLWSTG